MEDRLLDIVLLVSWLGIGVGVGITCKAPVLGENPLLFNISIGILGFLLFSHHL